ncbi:MAG: filamentous hemagglutinin N-terminal domain-containing protein [Phormidesmis sp. RL_2_1]|nr:filamentous hemagglutinin N-terminal domain-containing protein [Phormidesmis sp. RL_2_1]
MQTIFSTVTGNNSSNILGTLGTIGQSTPNLWLINPNGILFGPNSQLNLGGAFFATTANAVQVEGRGAVAASNVSADSDILTVSDSVFAFNRDNPNARIVNHKEKHFL